MQIATFRAPNFVPQVITGRNDLFIIESQLSEVLAIGLIARGFAVGPVVKVYFTSAVARRVGVDNKRFWINVSYDKKNDVWDVLVKSNQRLIYRILGRRDDKEKERLCNVIDEVLRVTPEVGEIRWQTVDEWLSTERIE